MAEVITPADWPALQKLILSIPSAVEEFRNEEEKKYPKRQFTEDGVVEYFMSGDDHHTFTLSVDRYELELWRSIGRKAQRMKNLNR